MPMAKGTPEYEAADAELKASKVYQDWASPSPVAYRVRYPLEGINVSWGYTELASWPRDGWEVEPLYTHPNPSPTSAENAPVDPSAAGEGWRDIDDEAVSGSRILLLWAPFGGVKEHVELGWFSQTATGWVNTYGKPFHISPDKWAPLAPFGSPPPTGEREAATQDTLYREGKELERQGNALLERAAAKFKEAYDAGSREGDIGFPDEQ